MKIKAIITGSTGMVGEGVLHECLNSYSVETVLVINRKSCGVIHPKLKEIIHNDFSDLSDIQDQIKEYNACYFCAGVSSVGKSEEEYKKITYDLTMGFADSIIKAIGDKVTNFTFCYVSGVGTDSSEKGRQAWARIKGKTENDLMKLPFYQTFMYRPGYIQPIKGLKNTYTVYKIAAPIYPLLKLLFPKYVNTLKDIANSMLKVTLNGYDKNILECEDIRNTA